jgi:hypothetical protein
VNTALASETRLGIYRLSRSLCRFPLLLVCPGFLVAPATFRGAELREETLKTWDTYLQAENLQLSSRLQGTFL